MSKSVQAESLFFVKTIINFYVILTFGLCTQNKKAFTIIHNNREKQKMIFDHFVYNALQNNKCLWAQHGKGKMFCEHHWRSLKAKSLKTARNSQFKKKQTVYLKKKKKNRQLTLLNMHIFCEFVTNLCFYVIWMKPNEHILKKLAFRA